MDRETCQAIVHRVAKGQTWLKWLSTQACCPIDTKCWFLAQSWLSLICDQVSHSFSFFFFLCWVHSFFFFNWRLIALQYCGGFLPYIHMNQPWVYMCSPSWPYLLPPSPSHPSGSSQCTSPEHPASCIDPELGIWFTFSTILSCLVLFSSHWELLTLLRMPSPSLLQEKDDTCLRIVNCFLGRLFWNYSTPIMTFTEFLSKLYSVPHIISKRFLLCPNKPHILLSCTSAVLKWVIMFDKILF